MSNNEYENGEFTLPSAAVTGLKKALRDDQNKARDAALAEAKLVHAKIKTTSRVAYKSQLDELTRYGRISDDAEEVLRAMLRRRGDNPPVVPILADVDRVAPAANNTTTTFPILTKSHGEAGEITIEGRKVTWQVWENNHAVDTAHDGRTAKVFFGYLDRIKWTRGTGGFTMYDTEYNEDSMGNRLGASLSRTWGPIGEAEQIWDYQRSGFSRAQATKMVKESARRATARAGRW